MKQLVSIVALLLGTIILAPAATLNDVKILEASENIKYLTQNIAKNYLYLYIYPDKQNLQDTIHHAIQELEKNIRTIAITTKAEKTKEILDFFAYEKEQIKLLLSQKPDITHASEILDFSEALTEGAKSIANSIQYDFSFEDKMFMRSKKIEYLIEKLAKYYMVLDSNIDKMTITDKLNKTVKEVEEDIGIMQQYTYPKALNTKKKDILKLWNANKHYYATVDTMKIPSIVLLSTNGLQNILSQMAIHHGKGE